MKYVLLFVCLIALSSCDYQSQAKQVKFYAFGTEIDVSLYGVDDPTVNHAVTSLEQAFSDINSTWHAWQPSTLTAINHAINTNKPIMVTDEVAKLITLATQLANSSQHLFNPAAGKLFELWGFQQDNWFESRPPPKKSDIHNWLAAAPTMNDIHIKEGKLTSYNPTAKIGFGGFAKGVAVDKAIATLKNLGITNAIVSIGGDLRAIGSHGKRSWIIGVRHPRQNGIIASIKLQKDESVFTSGDYERFFQYKGKRYTHIIDPRTGQPANQATSVTVLHHNASIADAGATALFVAGSDWPHIANAMDIKHVMLVRPDGQIEMSKAMQARIRLADNNTPVIIRSLNN